MQIYWDMFPGPHAPGSTCAVGAEGKFWNVSEDGPGRFSGLTAPKRAPTADIPADCCIVFRGNVLPRLRERSLASYFHQNGRALSWVVLNSWYSCGRILLAHSRQNTTIHFAVVVAAYHARISLTTCLSQVKVDEVLRFVGHIRPKVAAHDAVPGRIVLLVKLLLNEGRDVLWVGRRRTPRM